METPNDISEYIDFSNDDGDFKKAPLKDFIDKKIIVRDWKELKSRYSDGNESGKHVRMTVELNNEKFCVNTGSSIIVEQLSRILSVKRDKNESDMSFCCVLKKFGNGTKFYPVNFERR